MKEEQRMAAIGFAGMVIFACGLMMFPEGCVTSQQVTSTTNSVTGVVTTVTNTVVNQAQLAIDCGALTLVGTPAVTYAIQKDPSARPILVNVQTALNGALNGAGTNVVAQVTGLVGSNQALDSAITPLIQAASQLEQQELAKYGTNNAVIISKAVLQADLNIVTAALSAVPAK